MASSLPWNQYIYFHITETENRPRRQTLDILVERLHRRGYHDDRFVSVTTIMKIYLQRTACYYKIVCRPHETTHYVLLIICASCFVLNEGQFKKKYPFMISRLFSGIPDHKFRFFSVPLSYLSEPTVPQLCNIWSHDLACRPRDACVLQWILMAWRLHDTKPFLSQCWLQICTIFFSI